MCWRLCNPCSCPRTTLSCLLAYLRAGANSQILITFRNTLLIIRIKHYRTTVVRRDPWMSPVQPPSQSTFSWRRLLRAMSWWVLNLSKDGDSTASLRNVLWCLTTLVGVGFFLKLISSQNFPCSSLCPLSFVLPASTIFSIPYYHVVVL